MLRCVSFVIPTVALIGSLQAARALDPWSSSIVISGFDVPIVGASSVGGVFSSNTINNVTACAHSCLTAHFHECIAFNWHVAQKTCDLCTWSHNFTIVHDTASTEYFARQRGSNRTIVKPAFEYALQIPTSGVTLHSGVIAAAFEANIQYLLKFPVDDLLYWFRVRNATSGMPSPPGQSWGWDNGGPDRPYGLRGSVAGAFLMGAGGVSRWNVNTTQAVTLRARMHAVVKGIHDCRAPDGYIAAFPKNESTYHENPDYVTSWLTHGLLEATVAGDEAALPLLRGHFDWFNSATNLPTFLPPAAQTMPFDVDKTGQEFADGHKVYLIYQGIIHNTRLALSELGQQQDVDVATKRYAETWWLHQLAAQNLSAIWLRSLYPHNYEITAVEAYMDLYQLTGEQLYIDAVDGFWAMFKQHWMHIGGTVAIKEWKLYPPGSYYIDTTGYFPHGSATQHNCSLNPDVPDRLTCPKADPSCRTCGHSTGETCGQVFWIELNLRLHRLRPGNSSYMFEIERALLNGVVSQIPPVPVTNTNNTHTGTEESVLGIRQFAVLHKKKMVLSNISTCCEGQATRALGYLPKYIASCGRTSGNPEMYINIYADATISLAPMGLAKTGNVRVHTQWPEDTMVSVVVGGFGQGNNDGGVLTERSQLNPKLNLNLKFRIPEWITTATTTVVVTNAEGKVVQTTQGVRGSYLSLARLWSGNDTVIFSLPMALQVTRYTGLTVISGHKRYAVQYGPVLLACVGGVWDDDLDTMPIRGVATPTIASTWLTPLGTTGPQSLRFKVTTPNNDNITFIPYYEVQEEWFEVYPGFITGA